MAPTSPVRPPRRPPIWLIVAFAAGLLAAGWLLAGSYTSPVVRECLAAYDAAGTPADSAAVDTTVPAGPGARGFTCGWLRSSSRWP